MPAFALHMDLYRGGAEQSLPAEQPGVEPVQWGVGHAALPAPAQVSTGADAQMHGGGRGAQDGVVLHHAGQRVIVPAVDEQGRHRPFRQQGPEVHRIPKGIPGAAVSELVPVELQVDAGEPVDHLTER